ncbi:hypothetical protein GEMRC1_005181 [Eukaryota sp. GEM-RC1]
MSLHLSIITRCSDGLILYASEQDSPHLSADSIKKTARHLLNGLNQNSPKRCSFVQDAYEFHYIMNDNLCCLVCTDRSYPRALAFSYLEELQTQFDKQYGPRVPTASRPYEFIAFDTTASTLQRQYMDSSSSVNLDKAKKNLEDVRKIISKNIDDLVERGDRFEYLKTQTSALSMEAKRYKNKGRQAFRQLVMRQYVPLIVILLVIILYFFVRKLFKK